MKNASAMRDQLAQFLNLREPGRTAVVDRYELMTGGYSRVMARAEIRWLDGPLETLVLRGDPPESEAMLHTDRDVEWDVLRSLTELGAVSMPAPRYYDATAEPLGTKCIVLDCANGSSLSNLLQGSP